MHLKRLNAAVPLASHRPCISSSQCLSHTPCLSHTTQESSAALCCFLTRPGFPTDALGSSCCAGCSFSRLRSERCSLRLVSLTRSVMLWVRCSQYSILASARAVDKWPPQLASFSSLSVAAALSTALRSAPFSTQIRMTSSAGVWFASAEDRAALMAGVLLLLAALRFGFGLGLGALQYWYRWQLEDLSLSFNTVLPFLSRNHFPPSSFPLAVRGLVLCHDVTCDAEASHV